MRVLVFALLLICHPLALWAEDKLVRLYMPEALTESGLPKHMLPRFSLKTQVRIAPVGSPEEADLAFGSEGKPLFQGLGQNWHIDIRSPEHPGTKRLVDWLQSDVGQRTIRGFAPEGTPLFGAPEVRRVVVEVAVDDGDAKLGHEVSRSKCTRCHAVDAATRGFGIGSAPSFGVLRALPDWEERFSAFYVLNPHPSFTQIADLTAPFPIDRPSPIVPVEMTVDELEALMAYVSTMAAANLGKPLEHQ